MAQFQIDKSTNGAFYFRLRSTGNNKTVLISELYTSKSACQNGIDSVKENAPDESRYEKWAARNGEYYFTLKAKNGQIIGTSEMYATSASRDHGITVVKTEAPSATVADLT